MSRIFYNDTQTGKIMLNGVEYAASRVRDIVIDSVIPRMTSDTTPKGECSANYVYSGRYAYYGFTTDKNGDPSRAQDFWYCGGGSSADHWIEYEFDKPVTIFYVSFGTVVASGIGKIVKIQYSNDNINWADAVTITISTIDYTRYKLPFSFYCKYIRIFVVSSGLECLSGINAFGCEGTINTPFILKGTTEPTSAQGYDGQIYLRTQNNNIIYEAYAKVNGAWQNLIGTNVNDII